MSGNQNADSQGNSQSEMEMGGGEGDRELLHPFLSLLSLDITIA